MTHTEHEPYEISPRFFLAIQERALDLEQNADSDAHHAGTLTDPDHVRRHERLAQVQRAEAQRLRSFLADVRIRVRS